MSESLNKSPWGEESEPVSLRVTQNHLVRYFVIGGIVIFLALGGLGYYFFSRTTQPDASIEFSSTKEVRIGESFALTVSYSNYSDTILKNSTLIITLPDGLAFVGRPQDQRVMELTLGDVGPGSLSQQEFNLLALKDPQTLKRVEAKLSYQIPGSQGAQFEVVRNTDIRVGDPAVRLSVTAPQTVVNGERFKVDIDYENVSESELKNLRVKIDYPSAFQLSSTLPDPSISNNTWLIPSLSRGGHSTLHLEGALIAVQQSNFDFGISLFGDIGNERYVIGTQRASVNILTSPLAIRTAVNGRDTFVAHVGDILTYTIFYRNNAEIAFQDIALSAGLSGEFFDPSTISTNGLLNSVNNVISWNTSVAPELATLGAGEERSVTFSVRLKPQFTISKLSDKNYTLLVNVHAESPTVPPGVSGEKTISALRSETKIAGNADFRALGYFYDSASGIINGGLYPPRVNRSTQATIHWKITTSAADFTGVIVSAPLGPGVKFTGVAKSSQSTSTKPFYDADTHEMRWNVGNIAANHGPVTDPIEGVFQVEVTPSVNQVGTALLLVGNSKFEATESFTGTPLTLTSGSITTSLPDDTRAPAGERRVQP